MRPVEYYPLLVKKKVIKFNWFYRNRALKPGALTLIFIVIWRRILFIWDIENFELSRFELPRVRCIIHLYTEGVFHMYFLFDLEWVGLVTSLQGCCDWVNQNNIDSTLLAERYVLLVLYSFYRLDETAYIIRKWNHWIQFHIIKKNLYNSMK